MVPRAIERPARGRPLRDVGRISGRSRPCRSPRVCPLPGRCSRLRQPGSPIRSRRKGWPGRCSLRSRNRLACRCIRRRMRSCRCRRRSRWRRCSRRSRDCRACRCSRRRRCSRPCIRTEEWRDRPGRTGRCPQPPEERIPEPPAPSQPSGTSSHSLLSVRSGPSPGHRQLLLFW